jgi:isoleucyl-tRNA synthetase
MYHIVEAMVRWLAPVLSFTAEEVWSHLPGRREASVFHSVWHRLPAVPEDTIDWDALLALRGDVTRELERLREAGDIGSPLEAEVEIAVPSPDAARYGALGDDLRFFLITSAARVVVDAAVKSATVRVKATTAPKCVRCWHRREDVGQHADHPELCGRCVVNVAGSGEERRYA